jgi:hypothetical protein
MAGSMAAGCDNFPALGAFLLVDSGSASHSVGSAFVSWRAQSENLDACRGPIDHLRGVKRLELVTCQALLPAAFGGAVSA